MRMSGKKAKADALELENAEKAEKIIELRRTGATWSLIAKATGYANASGPYKVWQKAMENAVFPKIEEYRYMELDLYDRLQLGIYERAKNGDLRAVREVMAISKERRALLGLDAPTKIQAEVVTYDGAALKDITARIESLIEENWFPQSELDEDSSAPRAITNN